MAKKILLMSGHSRSAFKWGMVGEVIKRLLNVPEVELYYLDCNNNIKGYCGLNQRRHWGYCKKCSNVCLNIIKLAGLEESHILKMEKFNSPNFSKIKTIEDAINFEYEGYNYGLGPVSCIMSLARDYNFNMKKWYKTLIGYFKTEYTVFKNLEKLQERYNFDEIHTFNGRMPVIYPCVSFAKKHNIPYTIYERGAKIDRLRIIENDVPHDFNNLKREIKELWDTADETRDELAKKWFEDRRKGKYQAIESFTKDQIKNLLPKDFDTTKENFAYFNSSIDEVFAFDSWKHPFARTENDVIRAMLEHYKDDDSKHFYLRVHPNLTRAKKKKSTQIKEINEFKKLYKNLTVIEPDEKIDTYALMDACDKVLSTYSTTGCEATYWGKVSIIAGKATYEDIDCVYKANSMEELYALIEDKTLQAKPKENSYPYGYRNATYGSPYRYYKAKSHSEGEFLGLQLKNK